MKNKKLTRSYDLQINPNFLKLEEVRYNAQIYTKYLQHFITQLYFSTKKHLSTEGMGLLANQAQKKAIGMLAAHRESVKETGAKSNVPQIKFKVTPARIAKAKGTTFDYWVSITSQFKNNVFMPVKSHGYLNSVLKQGWKLSKYCEITEKKKGKWVCTVFVTKPYIAAVRPSRNTKSLGIDVGIKHASSRSDNYLGPNLSKLIKKEKQKQASRQRNKHLKKPFKSKVKQILDKEVNRAIRRSKRSGLTISIENPKSLANLRGGRLQGWARAYFGNRLQVRAEEEGIWVNLVNPAYTSITCSSCRKTDRESRVNQSTFICTCCGNTVHADLNSAKEIALKGQERLMKPSTDKIPVKP